jgi:hypothetical protein
MGPSPDSLIPRVLHFCWFGGQPLPPAAEACLASWRKHCPDYEIRRWDETCFDVTQTQFSAEAAGRRAWAFVADYARLKIVHDHGGIYLDTDVELVRSLDDLLAWDAFFGFQYDNTINTGHGFGAVAGHRLVGKLLAGYEDCSFFRPNGLPDRTPCPQRDLPAFIAMGFTPDGTRQERNGAVLLPAHCFCPKAFDTGVIRLHSETYAIHHFNASWHSSIEAGYLRRVRRYTRVFGERVGKALYSFDCRLRNLGVKCGLGKRWEEYDEHR